MLRQLNRNKDHHFCTSDQVNRKTYFLQNWASPHYKPSPIHTGIVMNDQSPRLLDGTDCFMVSIFCTAYIPRPFHSPKSSAVSIVCMYTDLGSRGMSAFNVAHVIVGEWHCYQLYFNADVMDMYSDWTLNEHIPRYRFDVSCLVEVFLESVVPGSIMRGGLWVIYNSTVSVLNWIPHS